MLRCSTHADLPALKALWQDCFGDPQEYIALYFDHYWQPERLFVLEAEGAPRAMCAWFELELHGAPAAYFYAVATDPAYQGRGFCRRLMSWAEETLTQAGIRQFLLVPGSESLFRFYAGMGYETAGAIGSVTVTEALPGDVKPLTADAYRQLRLALQPENAVDYPGEAVRYQEILCRFSGGGLFALGDCGCAVVEQLSETTLLVKEALGCEPLLAGGWLLHHCGADRAIVRFPEDGAPPFCMGKHLTRTPCYLGLAFD